MTAIIRLAIGFAIVSIVFWCIERIFQAVRYQGPRRRRTDLIYWIFTPLVTKAITRFSLLAILLPAIIVIGPAAFGDSILAGFGPVARLPVPLQLLVTLLAGDFLAYWGHRAFHRGALWPFHAVHHSSEQLDWLSSVRLHPVNDLLMRIFQAIPLLLLGFPAGVVAAYAPFLSLYGVLLHANVDWSFGPLRHVFASPRFHRWHHTAEVEGLDRNFAGLFPIWDVLFGTFYLPAGQGPRVFGLHGETMPEGLLGQLLYPFRRKGTRLPKTGLLDVDVDAAVLLGQGLEQRGVAGEVDRVDLDVPHGVDFAHLAQDVVGSRELARSG